MQPPPKKISLRRLALSHLQWRQMSFLPRWLGALTLLVTMPTHGQAPAAPIERPSFCGPREYVVFTCRTGARMVSICASDDASPTTGYLHYRFGKPERGELLELKLPVGMVRPPEAATGASAAFSGGGGAWLRFRTGAFAVVAYTGIGKWGPKGEIRTKQGVVVESNGKTVNTMKCTGARGSELGPEWFERVGVTAKGEEFDFPD
jgi:hypothetical protein